MRYLLLICLIMISLSCQKGPEILGHWQTTIGSESITFYKDHNFEMVDNMTTRVKGKYKIIKGNLLELNITHDNILKNGLEITSTPKIVKAKFSIRKNQLNLTLIEANEAIQYERIKTEQ